MASIMQDTAAIGLVADRLRPEHLDSPQHRACYEAMLDLYKASAPIDITTVTAALGQRKALSVVGASFVGGLHDDAISTAPGAIEHHLAIVVESHAKRSLHLATGTARAKLEDDTTKSLDVMSDLSGTIADLSQNLESKHASHIRDLLPGTFEEIQRASKSEGVLGVASGFADLDDLLGGFRPGQLCILAARPAVGKSSLATNIAANVGIVGEKSVVLFSLEMATNEVVMRMLSSEARVAGHKVSRGQLDDTDWPLLTDASTTLAGSGVIIDDSTALTPTALKAKCQAIRARWGLDLIIVDYLGLMRGERKYENRNNEVSEISWALKALAKDMDVPVPALSQFSREVERQQRRPILADLRDSGSLEQDADVVMFLHRPEDEGYTELIVAKNRGGRIGTVLLDWEAQYTRFDDYKEF